MRLLRLRRWGRLVVGVLLLAATTTWSHVPTDDLLCAADSGDYYQAAHGAGHCVSAGAKDENRTHCAICHLRSLRSPGPPTGDWIAGFIITAPVNRIATPTRSAAFANNLPARAPPSV
jgi:hypothetical protein